MNSLCRVLPFVERGLYPNSAPDISEPGISSRTKVLLRITTHCCKIKINNNITDNPRTSMPKTRPDYN